MYNRKRDLRIALFFQKGALMKKILFVVALALPLCSYAFTGPDLVVGPVEPPTAVVGTPLVLQAVVSNIGDYPIGSSQPWYDQFEVANWSGEIVQLPLVLAGPGLQPQSGRVVSQDHTFQSAGAHFVRACANVTGSMVESDYDNNCGPWTTIIVTGPRRHR